MKIDLEFGNEELYLGCDICEEGGERVIKTLPHFIKSIIKANVKRIIESDKGNHEEIILFGPLVASNDIWIYMIVSHVVIHHYRKIWYDNGRGDYILIAQN